MASLNANCAFTPAEDLHTSQSSLLHYCAHSARGKRFGSLKSGIWNIRSMVDTEGSVAVDKMEGGESKGKWA